MLRTEKWNMTRAMRTSTRASAIATVVLLVLMLTACGREISGQQARDNEMGLLILAESDRPPVPAITGEALGGGPIGIADFGGKVVVLNAFASWCPPCQQELPVLAAAEKQYPNVQFLGLDVQDNDEAALGFLAAEGATYPVIKDPAGDLLAQFTINPAKGLPVTFFIDEQGRVAGRILGKVTTESLAAAIKSLT